MCLARRSLPPCAALAATEFTLAPGSRRLAEDGRSFEEARPKAAQTRSRCFRCRAASLRTHRRSHSRRPQVFPVRCYEVGPDQLATMVTVANLLQEVAANHAQALWGEGAWAPALMTEQHLAFALSKLHIRMDAPMQWCVRKALRCGAFRRETGLSCRCALTQPSARRGSAVRLTTWFQEAGTLAARRDWTICDAASGARIGSATSTWLAFNLNTRRMARLPPALRTYFQTASPQPPRCVTCAHHPSHREISIMTSSHFQPRSAAGRWARRLRRSAARRSRPMRRAW